MNTFTPLGVRCCLKSFPSHFDSRIITFLRIKNEDKSDLVGRLDFSLPVKNIVLCQKWRDKHTAAAINPAHPWELPLFLHFSSPSWRRPTTTTTTATAAAALTYIKPLTDIGLFLVSRQCFSLKRLLAGEQRADRGGGKREAGEQLRNLTDGQTDSVHQALADSHGNA